MQNIPSRDRLALKRPILTVSTDLFEVIRDRLPPIIELHRHRNVLSGIVKGRIEDINLQALNCKPGGVASKPVNHARQ